jgi:uncharacterized protein
MVENITINDMKHHENLSQWRNIPKNESAPLVHRFETEHCKYVYDVNTGEILRVNDIVWDIVEDFGSLSKEKIVTKYASKYLPDAISAAYDQIVNKQKGEGLLLSKRLEVMFEFDDKNKESSRPFESDYRRLILKVSEACNFRCTYCPYTITSNMRQNHSNRMMSWKTAKAAIDNFLANCRKKNINKLFVYFYGGEPLLNFSLIKKSVRYLRKITKGESATFWISTNGFILSGSIAEFLASEKFFITVSLDGPEDIHNKNRRTIHGVKTWELVTNNIKAFLDKYYLHMESDGGSVNINAVLPPKADALEFDDFFNTFDLFGPNGFLRATLIDAPVAGVSDSPKDYLPNNLHRLKARYINDLIQNKIDRKRYTVTRNLFEKAFRAVHERNSTFSSCKSETFILPTSMCIPGITRYYVSVDGNYYPCEKVPECEEMRIGNVHEGINYVKAYQLSKNFFELNHKECKYCWCSRMCQVGCVANVRNGLQWTHKAKQDACARHRRERHNTLIDYCNVMEKNPHAFDYLRKTESV